jgi:hypothetical protein
MSMLLLFRIAHIIPVVLVHNGIFVEMFQASFPLGGKEFRVSTYQMCMLMMFNVETSHGSSDQFRSPLTLSMIRQGLGEVDEMEFRRHLLSLCTPKLKILKKSSRSKASMLEC